MASTLLHFVPAKDNKENAPGVNPTLPGSELLLIGSHYLYLKVIFEAQKEFVLLEELCPIHLAWAIQEFVTDDDPSLKLFLWTQQTHKVHILFGTLSTSRYDAQVVLLVCSDMMLKS